MTLVATNVAARGLDINDVQLIIQVCQFIFGKSLYDVFIWYILIQIFMF